MPGHRDYKELRARLAEKVGEDRLNESSRAARERYDAELRRLADVRHARALTQTQLANALGVSQAQVSRIETQADLYLSTLESYLEAMGARLELVAAFDDTGERVHFSIGELAPRPADDAEGGPPRANITTPAPDKFTKMIGGLGGNVREGPALGGATDPRGGRSTASDSRSMKPRRGRSTKGDAGGAGTRKK